MANQSFMPCFGIDNISEDAAMVQGGREPFVFVRDATNVNITPAGKLEMIASGGKVTDSSYKNIWQSPLHNSHPSRVRGFKHNTTNSQRRILFSHPSRLRGVM